MKKQLTDSRQQLTDLKKQGPALKLLLKEYDNAVASGNQTLIQMIERQIEMTGMTVDTLRKAVAQLDTIDEQIVRCIWKKESLVDVLRAQIAQGERKWLYGEGENIGQSISGEGCAHGGEGTPGVDLCAF